jgi:hypothetical protein
MGIGYTGPPVGIPATRSDERFQHAREAASELLLIARPELRAAPDLTANETHPTSAHTATRDP